MSFKCAKKINKKNELLHSADEEIFGLRIHKNMRSPPPWSRKLRFLSTSGVCMAEMSGL